MWTQQTDFFKRWKEIFLTTSKINTCPALGFVKTKKLKKKIEEDKRLWCEAEAGEILPLATLGGWCVWMAGKGREGKGFKSCLPAGGGSITFEQPHPFSFWVVDFLVILTGVLFCSSREIKTAKLSANTMLLITDEWNSKLLSGRFFFLLIFKTKKPKNKTMALGQQWPYLTSCFILLIWQYVVFFKLIIIVFCFLTKSKQKLQQTPGWTW